jgi:hypothetical protein
MKPWPNRRAFWNRTKRRPQRSGRTSTASISGSRRHVLHLCQTAKKQKPDAMSVLLIDADAACELAPRCFPRSLQFFLFLCVDSTMVTSPYVRNLLTIVGISSVVIMFLSYKEETASVWTAGTSYVRSATTTDTVSYDKPGVDEPVDEKPTLMEKPWPELKGLLTDNGESIVADVQFVLDFAIIGRKFSASPGSSFPLTFCLSNNRSEMRDNFSNELAGRPPGSADAQRGTSRDAVRTAGKTGRDVIRVGTGVSIQTWLQGSA